MATAHPVWVVPGEQWFNQISAVRRTLIEHIRSGQPLPISTITDMLPLNPVDGDTLNDLKARGALECGAGIVSNAAQDITRASFLDDNVGAVRLVIPRKLSARVGVGGDSIEFEATEGPMLLVLPDLPAQYPFSGNFLLRKLQVTPDFVVYTHQDQVEPHGFFDIKVDLRLAATPLVTLASLRAMPAHRMRKLRMAMKLMASEEDSCFAHFGGSSWYITRDMMGLCRIQHENEPAMGQKVYGPASEEECRKKLKQMEEDGSCA